MANRPAPALVLGPGDREELERWIRASTVEASAAKRARIVLLAVDGVANTRIAEGWNKRAEPFVWTVTADQILQKADNPTPSKACG